MDCSRFRRIFQKLAYNIKKEVIKHYSNCAKRGKYNLREWDIILKEAEQALYNVTQLDIC
jgi:hypothetical protein